jgi:hypothetical protein
MLPLPPAVTPPRCPLDPLYKPRAPLALTDPLPLTPKLPRALLRPRSELKLSLVFFTVALPLRRRSCFGEHPSSTASSDSSPPPWLASPSARALTRCRHVLLYTPPRSSKDLSHAARSTDGGPGPPNFPWKNNPVPEKSPLYL